MPNQGLIIVIICVCYGAGVASACRMSNKLTLLADKTIETWSVLREEN